MGPVALSPLSTFVAATGPLGGVHGIATGLVIARTSVPETRIVWAATPAKLTEIGSTKPTPSTVTLVPPNAVPWLGRMFVICIFGVYRKAFDAVTVLLEAT